MFKMFKRKVDTEVLTKKKLATMYIPNMYREVVELFISYNKEDIKEVIENSMEAEDKLSITILVVLKEFIDTTYDEYERVVCTGGHKTVYAEDGMSETVTSSNGYMKFIHSNDGKTISGAGIVDGEEVITHENQNSFRETIGGRLTQLRVSSVIDDVESVVSTTGSKVSINEYKKCNGKTLLMRSIDNGEETNYKYTGNVIRQTVRGVTYTRVTNDAGEIIKRFIGDKLVEDITYDDMGRVQTVIEEGVNNFYRYDTIENGFEILCNYEAVMTMTRGMSND